MDNTGNRPQFIFYEKVQQFLTCYYTSQAFIITEKNKRKLLKITEPPCLTTILLLSSSKSLFHQIILVFES